MAATLEKKRSILMLPWLAHGHISPFLELAKNLAQRNFHILFCSTPINLKPTGENYELTNSIQFIDLHLPPSEELPPHFHTTKDLPQLKFGHMIGLYTRDFRAANANAAVDYLTNLRFDDEYTEYLAAIRGNDGDWAPDRSAATSGSLFDAREVGSVLARGHWPVEIGSHLLLVFPSKDEAGRWQWRLRQPWAGS